MGPANYAQTTVELAQGLCPTVHHVRHLNTCYLITLVLGLVQVDTTITLTRHARPVFHPAKLAHHVLYVNPAYPTTIYSTVQHAQQHALMAQSQSSIAAKLAIQNALPA
jgi:hypothetical protein